MAGDLIALAGWNVDGGALDGSPLVLSLRVGV